ncbi:hypothetical protein SprV_0100239300 [Sparganum proliferum]
MSLVLLLCLAAIRRICLSFTSGAPSYTERCPRDIKVNAPAAALTGAFVGLAIIAIFVAFGGVQCHKRLKAKKAAGQD